MWELRQETFCSESKNMLASALCSAPYKARAFLIRFLHLQRSSLHSVMDLPKHSCREEEQWRTRDCRSSKAATVRISPVFAMCWSAFLHPRLSLSRGVLRLRGFLQVGPHHVAPPPKPEFLECGPPIWVSLAYNCESHNRGLDFWRPLNTARIRIDQRLFGHSL